MDKPLLGFILWSDSWGVVPDYIVSSTALIPLAPKPGLHCGNVILVWWPGGGHCSPQMSWCDGDSAGVVCVCVCERRGGVKQSSGVILAIC